MVGEMEAWDDACWELATKLEQYPSGERIWNAYWRTLIFNRETVGVEATEKLEIAYKIWMSMFITFNETLELSRANMVPTNAGGDATPMPEPTGWGLDWLGGKLSNRWQRTSVMFKKAKNLAIIKEQGKVSAPFDSAFKRYSFGRKFCTTKYGYMGWVPFGAQTGDPSCVISTDANSPSSFGAARMGMAIG